MEYAMTNGPLTIDLRRIGLRAINRHTRFSRDETENGEGPTRQITLTLQGQHPPGKNIADVYEQLDKLNIISSGWEIAEDNLKYTVSEIKVKHTVNSGIAAEWTIAMHHTVRIRPSITASRADMEN